MTEQAKQKYTLDDILDAVNTELPKTVEEAMDALVASEIGIGSETEQHPNIGVVRIKQLDGTGDLPLPEYQSNLASGMDIYAANDEPISLNSVGASCIVPTGICMEIPVGYEAQVRPRSGLAAKHGITVTNTPGTIDADYRGEIKVLLTNMSGGRFKVERGMRIAQIVICPVVQVELELVDNLGNTERGSGAFGSTGV